MASANGNRRRHVRRTPEEAGTVLSAALVKAMSELRMSVPMVARIAGRDDKTVTRWRTGSTVPQVHRLMPSRRLWRKFWSCVTELERKAGWL